MANNKIILGAEVLIDLTNATVTAEDMASGVVAYGADGAAVEGSVDIFNSDVSVGGTNLENQSIYHSDYTVGDYSGRNILATANATKKMILDEGTKIQILLTKTDLGTASTADVADGVTFSSKEGVQLTGTAPIGGGSAVNSGTISGTSASTEQTIDTGFTDLKSFSIVKTNYTSEATGLKEATIIDGTIMATSASSSWGSYVTMADASSSVTVNGGVVTISGGGSYSSQGLQGDYIWIAVEASATDIANTQNALSAMGVESTDNYNDNLSTLSELGVTNEIS